MGYDAAFFEQYGRYLQEPAVRKAHDWIFAIAALDEDFEDVIDLGCGTKEFYLWKPQIRTYYSVDVSPELKPTFCCDYRFADLSAPFREVLVHPVPTAFYSGFSSEITDDWVNNQKLYEKLFVTMPYLQAGLVSGFYYVSKKRWNPIQEAGGVTSWQTLELQELAYSAVYSERRIILPVPSEMFGPQENDVYEVWKFFKRR